MDWLLLAAGGLLLLALAVREIGTGTGGARQEPLPAASRPDAVDPGLQPWPDPGDVDNTAGPQPEVPPWPLPDWGTDAGGSDVSLLRPSYVRALDWEWMVNTCPGFAGLIAAIGWHETNWGRLGAGRSGYLLGVGVPTTGPVKPRYQGLENQVAWACERLTTWFGTRDYTLQSFIGFGRQVWRPGYYAGGRYVNTGEQWARSIWAIRADIIAHAGVAATAAARDVIHSG